MLSDCGGIQRKYHARTGLTRSDARNGRVDCDARSTSARKELTKVDQLKAMPTDRSAEVQRTWQAVQQIQTKRCCKKAPSSFDVSIASMQGFNPGLTSHAGNWPAGALCAFHMRLSM